MGFLINMANNLLKVFFSFQSAQSRDAQGDNAKAGGRVLQRERGLHYEVL